MSTKQDTDEINLAENMLGKNILITLLGGANAKYREANYVFNDKMTITSSYFGLALADYLHHSKNRIDKIVIIGTNGSFWDNLVKLVIPNPDDTRLNILAKLAQEDNISPEDLEIWQALLEKSFSDKYGIEEVELIINDYAITPEQQLGLISRLDTIARDATHITFDVTHAFRHLSMLSLMSAIVVHRLRRIPIEIFYGALDRSKNEQTPVLKLDGLLKIMDWLGALNSYDKDGDYSVFAPLITSLPDGEEAASHLMDASYNEYIGNFSGARIDIKNYQKLMSSPGKDNPIIVFSEALEKRFSWIEHEQLYDKQKQQALSALRRSDITRAAIWGLEAAISKVAIKKGMSPYKQQDRKKVVDNWDTYLKDTKLPQKELYLLKGIRNRLAHGSQGKQNEDVRYAMENRENCRAALSKTLNTLLK